MRLNIITLKSSILKKAFVFLILSIVISCEKVDTYPINVTILRPADGAIFVVGETVEIEARIIVIVKNGGQTSYIIDGNTVGYCNTYPCIYHWNTDGSDVGEHKIEVKKIDRDQNSGKDEITIILKEETPAID